MKLLLLILSLAAGLFAEDCIRAKGARVTAGEIAAVVPGAAVLPPDKPVLLAPSPGVRRAMGAVQLQAVLKQNGAAVDVANAVCIERVSSEAQRDAVERALEAALAALKPGEPVNFAVLDYFRGAVPEGQILLSPTGLSAVTDVAAPRYVWRGKVQFDGARSVAFWVTFTASMQKRSVRLKSAWTRGTPLTVDAVEEFEEVAGLLDDGPSLTLEGVLGKQLRKPGAMGEKLTAAMLENAPVIKRGESVSVVVKSRNAELKFSAIAETQAQAGEKLFLRGPMAGKRVTAVAVRQGEAVLVVPGGEE